MNLQSRLRAIPVKLWQAYLITGGVLTVGYYVALPYPAVRASIYTIIGISAVAAIAFSVITSRKDKQWTWSLIGIGVALYFIYDATYNFYRFFLHVPRPFPSVADLFFILSGIVLFTGLVQLTRNEEQRRSSFTFLDTLILAAGLSLIWWTVLMAPLAYNPIYTPLERFVAVAYPALDFLLATAGLRLALIAAKRTPAQYMVGGALVGLLGADIIYSILQLRGVYSVGTWLDIGWIWFYVLFGAAALYPRSRAASNLPAIESRVPAAMRNKIHVSLLTVAALLLPVSLVLSQLLRHGWQDPVVIGLGTILILLVILRLYRLMQDNVNLQFELARLKSDVLFRSIVERSYSGVSLFKPDLTAQYHSPNVYKIAAITDTSTNFRELVHPDDRARFNQFWLDTLASGNLADPVEYRLTNPDGNWADVETISNNLLEDEWIHNIVLITRDISDRKQYERHLQTMAYTDALTGLPNRAALNDRLDSALTKAKGEGRIAGIIFIDLDGFHTVNTNFGHTIGDALLREFGRRLSHHLYEGDSLARFGGDEFMIVSSNLQEAADAYLMNQRITSQLRQPFQIGGYQIFITACTGIALSEDNLGAAEMLRNADLALRRAKSKGQGTMQIFNGQLLQENQRRHALSSHLRDILFNSETTSPMQLTFQVIENLTDTHVTRMEVAPQLHHPDFGNIRMDELSDVAHGSDLLAELESRVLGETLKILHNWRPLLADHACVTSINITAASFSLPNFDRVLAEGLLRENLLPSMVAIEVAEKDLVGNETSARMALQSIDDIGVEVIIDRFGEEYSSITQLQRIPHAAIKLDSSLVQSIHDPDSALLVEGVVDIAHKFGRIAIAEGIRSSKQASIMKSLGCDFGQGSYFGKPLTVDEMEARLRGLDHEKNRRSA